jgi:hypothetical protein
MKKELSDAVLSAQTSKVAFCKYVTPNDSGATRSHQAGFHMPKKSWPLFFDSPGTKDSNKDKYVTIKWHDGTETTSRFIYYGVGSRNEYRLTRSFPDLTPDNAGDLLILCKHSEDYYEGFVLQGDENIEDFFAELNISSNDTNKIIPKISNEQPENLLIECFMAFIKGLAIDFPPTLELATNARNCYNTAYKISRSAIIKAPDKILLNWLDSEFQLFKVLENDRYSHKIQSPFSSVEELIVFANTILNRRKSRAGKSLEHHLAEIFTISNLTFENQATTEDNKKPDFLFPGQTAYRIAANGDNLISLAAKTTCKDRWRQILNEADKIKTKHLFTLQQGISKNQLDEMYKYNVNLVVPSPYLKSYPEEYQGRIITLDSFIGRVKALTT